MGAKTSLYLEIKKNGETRVSLTLPSKVIKNFEGLLPNKARKIIFDRGIDLDSIKSKVIKSNYSACELLTLYVEEENKEIRIWLE